MPTCPVCGYPSLEEPPRSPSGGGSYEICPSCGFQFGVDDDDKGITHEQWRARWAENGMSWSSRGIPAPTSWNAKAQLATVAKPADASKNVAPKTLVRAAKPARKSKPARKATPVKKTARKKR